MLLKLTELTRRGQDIEDREVFVNTDYILAIHAGEMAREGTIDTLNGKHSTESVRIIEFANTQIVVRETFDELENLL